MKKALIVALCAVLLLISVAGCGNSASQLSAISNSPETASAPPEQPVATEPAEPKTPAAPTQTPEPAPPAPTDFTDAYTAYLQLIRNNRTYIDAYTWQQDGEPIALCNVVGDATPELFYTETPSVEVYTAYLHIYTYEDGEAKEIFSKDVDKLAGGGFNYCLFLTTDGRIFLYESASGEPWILSFAEYVLAPAGDSLVVSETLTHRKMPSEDYTSTTHNYALNGAEITAGDYEARTAAIIDSISAVIMSGGREGEAIWDKISEVDNFSMSCSSAITFLENAVHGTRPADKPFTKEEAISYTMPLILADWGKYISKDVIPENTTYSVTVSDKLLDGQPIYLVDYSIYRIGGGRALVFADGNVISEYDAEFSSYNDYFAMDITAY